VPYVVGLNLLLLSSYAVGYSIFSLRSFTLALSDDICCVTYTTESPLGGPDSRVIRTTPSHYIVRVAEGLLYVSAVRSSDKFYYLFVSLRGLNLHQLQAILVSFLTRPPKVGPAPGGKVFRPPPAARVDRLKSLHKIGNVESGFGLKGLICTGYR